MTELPPPTNPLLNRPRLVASRKPFFDLDGEQVPTDLDGYCQWLNGRDPRRGRWRIFEDSDTRMRRLEWIPEVATDEWLREHNLIPRVGRRA